MNIVIEFRLCCYVYYCSIAEREMYYSLPMTYFACEKISSLEVRTPAGTVQLQLMRVVLLTKPIYMPLPKLEVHSDGCSSKIMPVWSHIVPNSKIMLALES